MDLQRYISYLYTIKDRNPKLGDAAKDCLARFGLSTYTSAWQCYKYMNSENHKISYKNVYKRVRKFYELGLIEKRVKGSKTKHNAIYFRLTSFGIFYLFKHGFGKQLVEGHTLVNYESDVHVQNFYASLYQQRNYK